MKLVIDTNTLISGSFWRGPSAQVLEAVARNKAELIMSPDLLAEFAEVVSRSKFARFLASARTTGPALALKLASEATIILPAPLPMPPELRDPKDLHILACAVSGKVDFIVTGDADLLSISPFQSIPILTPRAALDRINQP